MRPTNLKFVSPKQRTPGAYFPVITSTSRRLSIGQVQPRTSFGSSIRFGQTDIDNRFRVGPGSYDNDKQRIQIKRIKGNCQYKQFHKGRDTGDNSYYFIGNHMIFDSNFPKFHEKKNKKAYSLMSTRTSKGSSRRKSVSPWFLRASQFSPDKRESVKRIISRKYQVQY